MAEKKMLGQTILGYQVVEELGAGTYGTVYKAMKSNASGDYIRALKHITIPTSKQYIAVLNSMGGDYSKADDYFEKALQDIVSEIKILNSLSEKGAKNIVRYYENDIVETVSPRRYDVYILMEYLTPFCDFMGMQDFTIEDVMNLGLDILSALKICHQNGIIHRDIKDDNIFVTEEKQFKIGDFGVSKVLKDKSKAESMKGTPNFIAPEVYLGKEGYTSSVDLYSLGIVLYKLLNYSRIPFLPQFPAEYDATDEDKAFEARMKGYIPPLPLEGGNELGQIIIKAISGKETRYTNAEDFYTDLNKVKNSVEPELLHKKINMMVQMQNTADHQNDLVADNEYEETIGENDMNSISYDQNKKVSTTNSDINKNLFDTIGEQSIQIDQDPRSTNEIINKHYPRGSNSSSFTGNHKAFVHTNKQASPPKVAAVNKKDLKWVIFSIPFVIALIVLIIYSFIIPKTYGNAVSFIDWLFSNPENIVDTLRDPNMVLPRVYNIIFLKVGTYVLTIVFITSLFMVGKQLHRKNEPDNLDALLKGKEAFFNAMKISAALKEAKGKINNMDIEKLSHKMKILQEKLSIESDFGYSNKSITDCENEIAHLLDHLYNMANALTSDEKMMVYQSNINECISRIQALLNQRTEMKKR